MNQTGTSTAQIVQAYYDILTAGIAAYDPARLRALLATDLVFEGPIAGHVVGAERFSKGVSGFIETMRSLTMVHQLYAGDTAATLYDAEMPGGTVRFAEFFHVEDGKIQTLRLLYDATEYRARGGR
jgi:ketosteroid isomerase-like protein